VVVPTVEALVELGVLPFGLRHGLRLKFLRITVKAYEQAPACEQNTARDHDARRKEQLTRLVMRSLEGCNKSFNRKRHDNDNQKSRQEPPYAGRSANVSPPYDLFFGDRLCNL